MNVIKAIKEKSTKRLLWESFVWFIVIAMITSPIFIYLV